MFWGKTSKLWCCRGCPKGLCVCVTASVPTDGVILGVSHVLSSGEMSVAPGVLLSDPCSSSGRAGTSFDGPTNSSLRSLMLLPGVVASFGGFMGFFAHPEMPARSRACSGGSWMLIPALWFSQGRAVPGIPFGVPVLHSWQELCVHACQG